MFQYWFTYARIVGNPNATDSVVSNRCHLPGASSPVLVVTVVLKRIVSYSFSPSLRSQYLGHGVLVAVIDVS